MYERNIKGVVVDAGHGGYLYNRDIKKYVKALKNKDLMKKLRQDIETAEKVVNIKTDN